MLSTDYEILGLVKPSLLNFVVSPIVRLINSYIISSVCGNDKLIIQNVVNQIFNVTLGFFTFLPLVLSPFVSKFNCNNKYKKIIQIMNNSILLYFIIGLLVSTLLFSYSSYFLSYFISIESSFLFETIEFLRIKCLIIPIVLINLVITSVLKGIIELKNIMDINLKSQIINMFLDYTFINLLGINGSAISYIISELYRFYKYIIILNKKNMIIPDNSNFCKNIMTILKDGFFVQIRSIIGNFNYYLLNKQVSNLDTNGYISASHIFCCRILEILLISFTSISSIVSIIIAKYNYDSVKVKFIIKRMIILSIIIAFIQFILVYMLSDLVYLLTDELIILKYINNILPVIIIYSNISGISMIMDSILHGKNEFKIQTYLSLISLIIVSFLIHYCKELIDIWYLISFIFSIRVLINTFFLRKVIKE